jgi:hypothetical protein
MYVYMYDVDVYIVVTRRLIYCWIKYLEINNQRMRE